jgi:hypothetical protein
MNNLAFKQKSDRNSYVPDFSSVSNFPCHSSTFFPPGALRSHSGTWPPLTELGDHTYWAHHTWKDSSARDLYLATHKNHKRQISMPPAGFEHAIPACERPQTHALDRAAKESALHQHAILKFSFPPVILKYINFVTWARTHPLSRR